MNEQEIQKSSPTEIRTNENPVYDNQNRNKNKHKLRDPSKYGEENPVYENIIRETEDNQLNHSLTENTENESVFIETSKHQVKDLLTKEIRNHGNPVDENVIRETTEQDMKGSPQEKYQSLASGGAPIADYHKVIRMGLCKTDSQNEIIQELNQ